MKQFIESITMITMGAEQTYTALNTLRICTIHHLYVRVVSSYQSRPGTITK